MPEWSQLQAADELYAISIGERRADYMLDWYYIKLGLNPWSR